MGRIFRPPISDLESFSIRRFRFFPREEESCSRNHSRECVQLSFHHFHTTSSWGSWFSFCDLHGIILANVFNSVFIIFILLLHGVHGFHSVIFTGSFSRMCSTQFSSFSYYFFMGFMVFIL